MVTGNWLRSFAIALATLCIASVVNAAEPSLSEEVSKGISDSTLVKIWYIAPITSLLALFFAYFFYKKMMAEDEGTDKMKEIAAHVREGAYAYLKAQYTTVAIVFVVLVAILFVLTYFGVQNPFVPVAFLTGGIFSALCGFLGMKTSTSASARTAWGAKTSLNKGLQIAFRSGAVMGLVVVGFGLLDICAWYYILDKWAFTPENFTNGVRLFGDVYLVGHYPEYVTNGELNAEGIRAKYIQITTTMLTFGMGVSVQALFARVGGGIYTKAADVGADLVGKVEKDIPEDDPRNPATIADNVGDNVGDVAGMGVDLYESYCASILATAALGAAIPGLGLKGILAPMIIAGIGNLLSILGIFIVRCDEKANMLSLLRALGKGVWVSSVLIVVASALMAYFGVITWGVFGAVIAGLLAGVVIGQFTEYYTSDEYKPTRGIANQTKMGPATTIIDGLAVGMYSSCWPVVTITGGILLAFGLAGGFSDFAVGLYGVGFAAVGMLATLGITLATDAYGPIADNAGGNAEMAGLEPEVRERTDALDMLGNTTAATGKGFAIGSAALTATALLVAYLEEVRIWISKIANKAEGLLQVGSVSFITDRYKGEGEFVNIKNATIDDFVQAYNLSVLNPQLICGVFIGAMVTFVFCAMTMKAVGRAAGAMVEEVRRQFSGERGKAIMEYKVKPDYAACVAISTKGAQREMIIPSLLAVVVPVLVGLLLGVSGVIGLLVGALTSGFALACMLNNAGGAWDNAKKHIEKQKKEYAADDKDHLHPLSGKGSDSHKAAVVGDTVGDPFKDTSGPSLNTLIKLMSVVSIVFSGVVVSIASKWEGDAIKHVLVGLRKLLGLE